MNRKNLVELIGTATATAALCGCASAPTPQRTASPQVGDTYEISLAQDSAQRGSDGSSGS